MNATCERLVGTLRRELLVRVLVLGAAHLLAVLAEHQKHYNTARPHQGIGQRVPDAEHQPPRITAGHLHARQIRRKSVLSGPDQRVRPSRMNSMKTQLTTQNPIFERHKSCTRSSQWGSENPRAVLGFAAQFLASQASGILACDFLHVDTVLLRHAQCCS